MVRQELVDNEFFGTANGLVLHVLGTKSLSRLLLVRLKLVDNEFFGTTNGLILHVLGTKSLSLVFVSGLLPPNILSTTTARAARRALTIAVIVLDVVALNRSRIRVDLRIVLIAADLLCLRLLFDGHLLLTALILDTLCNLVLGW